MSTEPTNPIIESTLELPFEKLSADEIQELRRIMEDTRKGVGNFRLPTLQITDADKDRFAECLAQGKPYTEIFTRYNGKLKITLRSKLKREEDDIVEQIYRDFEDKHTKTQGQYANRLNVYNLCYQIVEIDGVKHIPPAKKANLREFVEKSIFEDMLEPKLYVLISLLSQFDTKVTALCRLATPEEDFTPPGADS